MYREDMNSFAFTPARGGRTLALATWLASLVLDGWVIDLSDDEGGIVGVAPIGDPRLQPKTVYVASGSRESAERLFEFVMELVEAGDV